MAQIPEFLDHRKLLEASLLSASYQTHVVLSLIATQCQSLGGGFIDSTLRSYVQALIVSWSIWNRVE